MTRRRKWMAIAMCALAVAGVAKNELGKAMGRANGALITADHRWDPNAGENGTCSDCQASANQSCDVTITTAPCTCWVGNPTNTFEASTLSSSNCVALYQQP